MCIADWKVILHLLFLKEFKNKEISKIMRTSDLRDASKEINELPSFAYRIIFAEENKDALNKVRLRPFWRFLGIPFISPKNSNAILDGTAIVTFVDPQDGQCYECAIWRLRPKL